MLELSLAAKVVIIVILSIAGIWLGNWLGGRILPARLIPGIDLESLTFEVIMFHVPPILIYAAVKAVGKPCSTPQPQRRPAGAVAVRSPANTAS